jgi:C1A family cysteine protease
MSDIPESADIRGYLWGVEHVGSMAAAAASAVATALEYHCNRINEPPTNLSTLFIHYNARIVAGQEGQNVGTTLGNAMKAAVQYGACRDAMWPLDATKINVKPPAEAYEDAKRYQKLRYFSPADPMEAISKKYPVATAISMPWHCIDAAKKTGVIATPTPQEMRGALHHHAVVLVGYDKKAGTYTARNCWGPEWGHGGHFTIPFDVLKMIAPETIRYMIIATPESAVKEAAPAAAAPASHSFEPAASSEKMSDIAAKLKEQIRGDLKKDIEDAQRRIREMMKKPGQQ